MSMKLPRDMGGADLAKALAQYGYQVTRQTGSHLRLTSKQQGEHHITIPAHEMLRIGTLNSILNDVAQYLKRNKVDLIQELWG
jgi:predicted RNA binding protein YcfA (HicA-like mRNA interferase family)